MMTEEKKMTLWEILKEKLNGEKEDPQELRVYNPMKARVGDFVSIEAAGLAEKNFTVMEVDVYHCLSEEGDFDIVNYFLRENDNSVHLRIFPISDADPLSHKHCVALVLFPDFEMGYDEKFHKEILPSGILEVKGEKGELLATYYRRNNLKEPFEAEVKVIENSEKPPKIEKWHFWDFNREVDGEIEYYFVEMNAENGSFQMFRGCEVSEKDILVMPNQKS